MKAVTEGCGKVEITWGGDGASGLGKTALGAEGVKDGRDVVVAIAADTYWIAGVGMLSRVTPLASFIDLPSPTA